MSSSSSSALSWTSTATRSPNISTLRSSLGGRLSSDFRRRRARSLRRNVVDLLGRPLGGHGERPVPEAPIARVGPDERLGPERDRLLEGVVGPEVDGAGDLGAVQEELRRPRQRGQVSLAGPRRPSLTAAHSSLTQATKKARLDRCRTPVLTLWPVATAAHAAPADVHGGRQGGRGDPRARSIRRTPLTVADAAAQTGLPLRDAESGLKWLSTEYRGQLRVTNEGQLVHVFPTGFTKPWEGARRSQALLRRRSGAVSWECCASSCAPGSRSCSSATPRSSSRSSSR